MIEVLEASKTYGSGESATVALKGVSLKINDGDFTVLLGASGSGKSTLLYIVSGLECPDRGSVNYDGVDITALRDDKLTVFRKERGGSFSSNIICFLILTLIRMLRWVRT